VDVTKFPLEKLVRFVAGVIPGFAALLMFQFVSPGSFQWFFDLGFLGYRTKLAFILVVAFVVGNSLTEFLSRFLGALGGAIGAVYWARRPIESSSSLAVAPWRDPRWRTVLRKQLGAEAPKDTSLISEELFQLRRAHIMEFVPAEDRASELAKLHLEKLGAEIEDSRWSSWYNHYHGLVLLSEKRDFAWHVANGLNFNLQATSFYVLASAFVVRDVRHWWCILPAGFWLLTLVAEIYTAYKNIINSWSTLGQQITYLGEQEAQDSRRLTGAEWTDGQATWRR
jgi:hypothetical protein